MNTVTHVKLPVLRALLLSALVASLASAQTAAYNNDLSGHWA
jgi:hypothetical protein